ncbi:MAG: hypothetical protein ACRDT4_17460 [Micromonosporaceae bacterium]
MAYPQSAPPPPVNPSEIRPGRAGYWVAGVIAVLGVCAGIGIAAFGFSSIAGDLPKMKAEFQGETTVKLESGKDWAVYVDNPALEGRAGNSAAPVRAPQVECTGTSADGGNITFSDPGGAFHFASGDRNWQLLYAVSVDKTGSYTVTCASSDPDLPDPTYAVGTAVNVGGFVGKLFGSLGALCGIPCLALLVAGVIALVVAMRRSSAKKRLQSGGPGAGGPGGGAPPPPGYPPTGPPPPG